MADKTVLIVGSSDGIGLALARRLLAQNYRVIGISRSQSSVNHPQFLQLRMDVTSDEYGESLGQLLVREGPFAGVVYCAAIAGRSDIDTLGLDLRVFDVNLMGAVKTAECVLSHFTSNGKGRFIVLSSQADGIVNAQASSYTASKAAVTQYFEGLGLRLRHGTVAISVVRFGFVATKLARSGWQPCRISPDVAAGYLQNLLEKPKPELRATYPKRIAPLVFFVRHLQRLRVFWL